MESKEILAEIERQQKFIDEAEKQIKWMEKIDSNNARRQIYYLNQNVIPFRKDKISKLKKQLLND